MEDFQRKPFLVGDIHGCFFEFLDLLSAVNYDRTKHRLILLGDIINRGPHSWEMLKWVKSHNVEIIQGNHEEAFIRFARGNQPITPALDELKRQMDKDLESWLTWMESWPLYIESENFIAVHAGLDPGKHPKDSDIRTLLYIRTWDEKNKTLGDSAHPPWYKFYTEEKLIIYGHWAKQGLQIRQNTHRPGYRMCLRKETLRHFTSGKKNLSSSGSEKLLFPISRGIFLTLSLLI